ncbi:ketopantoate reductase family protein [Szabonella alba]|uniref:2-dehydropantoate 2-reductase n=1 Tax=Szabonella alba TaxID=2804194 RepID=A0A8K0V6R4_9RHOB|nr:2-dehydropantoate 2-reductase [Szabonella alba]MBL4916779.1 2-dehydropantoate 2-reductase [Szabonella alba]
MSGPILIWGAGAIGGTLGAALLRAGETVVFVDTDAAHVAAINETGLRIEGPIFRDLVQAPAFTPDRVTGVYDRIFLCVKAQHTAAATKSLAPFLSPQGYVLSAQNGLNELEIQAIIGPERTIGCFVNFGADWMEPGVVHYSGRGTMVIGELDGDISPRLEALHMLLLGFDENARMTSAIWSYLWGKLIYGALLFGTALTNESIADALEAETWRPVFLRLGQEVVRVAQAQGVTLRGFDGFEPDAFLPGADAAVIADSFARMVIQNRRSTKSHSGIWRDLAIRKRRTEADAQIGPIVTIGAKLGVATPVTARLVAMIHEIEEGQRPLAAENLDMLDRETRGA